MNTPPRLSTLAPEAALRRLELLVHRRLDGLLHGDHLSLVPGAGSEPAESRVYRIGDDVRWMDWNVTARTTVPHVRDPEADRELETWALVDLSASLDFGTARCEKRDLAVAAVAAVGFLTARGGNRLGALVVQGASVRRIPARPGREPLLGLLRSLVTTPRSPGGEPPAALGDALEKLTRPPPPRRLVVVVSDFLADPVTWERPLRALAARHQVLAVEVLDPRELTLPDVGFLTLVDPETGRLAEVQTARRGLRERYAAAAAAQRAAIAAALRRAGADHLQLSTDRDWLLDLARHVALARRRRGTAAAVLPRAGPAGPTAPPGPPLRHPSRGGAPGRTAPPAVPPSSSPSPIGSPP